MAKTDTTKAATNAADLDALFDGDVVAVAGEKPKSWAPQLAADISNLKEPARLEAIKERGCVSTAKYIQGTLVAMPAYGNLCLFLTGTVDCDGKELGDVLLPSGAAYDAAWYNDGTPLRVAFRTTEKNPHGGNDIVRYTLLTSRKYKALPKQRDDITLKQKSKEQREYEKSLRVLKNAWEGKQLTTATAKVAHAQALLAAGKPITINPETGEVIDSEENPF